MTKKRYQLPQARSFRELMTTPAPAPDWIIEGLTPGNVGIISAAGGTGKTMFGLALAAAVAAGSDLFGRWSVGSPGDVVYLNGDDDDPEIHRRANALATATNLTGDEMDRIQSIGVSADPPRVMVCGTDRSGIAQSQKDEIAAIVQMVLSRPRPRLLILDPMRKFHALEENSNTDMEQYVTLWGRIAKELHIGVILIHHTGKSAVLNGQSNIQQSARGASAIVDQARWHITLSGLSAQSAGGLGIPENEIRNYLIATCAKINGAASLPDLLLRRGTGGGLMLSDFPKKRRHLKVDEGVPIDEE